MKNRLIGWFWLTIEALPIILPVSLAGFGTVAVLLLLFGHLDNWLIWPLGFLVAILVCIPAARAVPRTTRLGSKKEQRIFDLIIILGAIFWIGFNLSYASQSVFIDRDPGIYTNTGAWLVNHDKTNIPTPNPFGTNVPGLTSQSAGVWRYVVNPLDVHGPTESTYVQPQGTHLLPAFLGLAGRIAGEKAIFYVNILFGGIALLAVYGFGRLLVRPRWAAIATAVIAFSLPLIYFSRDTYTEPLALLFTFSGLALVWMAQQSKRRKLLLWLVAGLTAGAAALARADGYLFVAALFVFLIIASAIGRKTERKYLLQNAGAFVVGSTITCTIAWLDIYHLSGAYYYGGGKSIKPEALLLAALLIIGIIVVSISWHTKAVAFIDIHTKRWRPLAAAIIVLVGGLFLFSRPIWMTGMYPSSVSSPGIGFIENLQSSLGEPVSARTYYEHSFDWVRWYIGPTLAVLGIVGLAIATHRAMKRRDLLLIAGLLTVLGFSAAFLTSTGISPDQIWASRRILPVILPGFAIFGAFALDEIDRRLFSQERFGKLFAVLLASSILLAPLLTSRPFLRVSEKENELATMEAVCSALPKHAAVLWLGSVLQLDAVSATRSFCGASTMGYNYAATSAYSQSRGFSATTLANLARNAREKGYVPLIAIYGHQLDQLNPMYRSEITRVAVKSYTEAAKTLERPPTSTTDIVDSINLGIIQPNGEVTPLAKS